MWPDIPFERSPKSSRRRGRLGARSFLLLIVLSVSSFVIIVLATPAIPAVHAAQPIPASEYFGNTYNTTQTGSIIVKNPSQVLDIRFTARYGGTATPLVYVSGDYYQPGAEYDLLIGIQTDNSGEPSGHFLGAFVWNVSSGIGNGHGGWVYPGFAPEAQPLNHTITLAAGDVYHIVMKFFNGTFLGPPSFLSPPHCEKADCLSIGYIGGTNFQQESLDMHYDPSQALLSCANASSCSVVPGANPVYALAFNGSILWQGQVENGIFNRGVGAAKGGTGLNSYQGERFWMSSKTVTVNRLQVILSRIGTPTGQLNVIIWNFTAASASSILHSSDPRLVLNQTLISNLRSMPGVANQAFNFSLSENVTFQTGHLYQISFVIYGNTTVVGGSNEVGIAATGTIYPFDLSWNGAGGSTAGPCQQYIGGCAGFRYTGGAGNSFADEDVSEDLIFIMKIVSSSVVQPVSIAMSDSAPNATVSVNGCYPTPSTLPSDGKTHLILVIPACTFTLSFSNLANTRDGFPVSGSLTPVSPPQSSCSLGTCPIVHLTAYEQLRNTYLAKPVDPVAWDANLTIAVSGTQLGSPGQTGCSISTVFAEGASSCTAWFDYHTQVNVASPIAVSPTERWVQSGENNFTQTNGGNQDTVGFIDQFQIDFTANPLGAGSTNPSGSKVWESYGSLPVTATPKAGYLFNNWSADVREITFASADRAVTTAIVLGSGNITATFSAQVTQPITLTLAEQNGTPANFTLSGCSVSPESLYGDGKPHFFVALPSCKLTITLASDLPDARYEFSSENAISNVTSVTTCLEKTCSEFSAIYYEQVSEQFAYTVVGGVAPYVKAPVLTFISFGTPTTHTVAVNPTPQWLDLGTPWSLVNPLSGSTTGERWVAFSGTSGTATRGGERNATYQHQYSVSVLADPVGCGSTTPSGANWENSGASFQITSSVTSSCTFSAWKATGLVTVAQPGQLSTTAFADSNGTITASFSRNPLPTLTLRTIIAIIGAVMIAAGVITEVVVLVSRRTKT
jgi:hypothetical protein